MAGWRFDAVVAGVIAAGTLALLTATLGDYGFAWDEGFTVEREDRLEEWFARVAGVSAPSSLAWAPTTSYLERRSDYLRRAGASARSPWGRESLRFFWPFAREEPNGHPPFYALLGVAGRTVGRHVLPPPGSYRFGPAVLFALTVGAVYAVNARHFGRVAGFTAALGLVTMPRVFAHAHLASYDAPTLCLWFLTAAAFLRAAGPPAGGRLATLWFGVALGCAASTKLTGWFLPIPLAAWALYYRDRRAARALGFGVLVAALVIYALNPTWWWEPAEGLRAFLRSNLSRERHSLIPTLFLGRVYPFSLPWYNTLVLTAVVVPPATLALAAAGIVRVVAGRFRDRAATLFLVCWAFLMALRALPAAPGHDVERQFLASFVFLACLAGPGASWLGVLVARFAAPRLASLSTAVVVAAALAGGAWETWRYHPTQLSYYNALIGGLSGASRAGLEPTYYWDALTPDVRDWLNAHTRADQSVAFPDAIPSFEYLHRWGLLRPASVPDRTHPPRWYVVQNRPGMLRYFEHGLPARLTGHARPVFVKTLAVAPDVPLIFIFSADDASAAQLDLNRQAGRRPAP